jgi:hypothetical protein
MAKFTEEQLEEARGYIREMKWDMLELWMDEHKVVIDRKVAMDMFKKCMRAKDEEKAMKMFNAGFADMDPAVDRLAGKIRFYGGCGCLIFVCLGILGGIVYLFNWLF